MEEGIVMVFTGQSQYPHDLTTSVGIKFFSMHVTIHLHVHIFIYWRDQLLVPGSPFMISGTLFSCSASSINNHGARPFLRAVCRTGVAE
jgi:hypothetical protein